MDLLNIFLLIVGGALASGSGLGGGGSMFIRAIYSCLFLFIFVYFCY